MATSMLKYIMIQVYIFFLTVDKKELMNKVAPEKLFAVVVST